MKLKYLIHERVVLSYQNSEQFGQVLFINIPTAKKQDMVQSQCPGGG